MTSSNGLNIISPSFPNEYPNNVNCTCAIEPAELNQQSLPVMIDVEVGINDFIGIRSFLGIFKSRSVKRKF